MLCEAGAVAIVFLCHPEGRLAGGQAFPDDHSRKAQEVSRDVVPCHPQGGLQEPAGDDDPHSQLCAPQTPLWSASRQRSCGPSIMAGTTWVPEEESSSDEDCDGIVKL